MTVSGAHDPSVVPTPAQLVQASVAQEYVADLAKEIEALDGGPVYLLDDGETGTSDAVIMHAKDELWSGGTIENTTLASVLRWCFSNGFNFRIWLADNNPRAHVENAEPVRDFDSAVKALKRGGAYWHANSTME